MRQFGLEEYLKNPNRKVVTRNGQSARIICTDKIGKNKPVVALVYDEYREEEYGYNYYSNGKIRLQEDNNLDLFFAPTKHEGWQNIYRDYDDYYGGDIYSTEQEAKEAIDDDEDDTYVATIKIEWEE